MADDTDEWDFIGDSPEWELASGFSFSPPVSKASAFLPPPPTQCYPRSPARLQVPSALQQSHAARGALTSNVGSHTSCRFTVNDVTSHDRQTFGVHRASPYQVSDLHPGVLE